jgi:hypothetical protein
MPTGRYGLVAASVNGIVYVIGGWSNGTLRTVETYHPTTNGDVKTATCSEVAVRLIVGMSWPSPPPNQRCGFLKSPLIFCLASSLASAFFS